MPTYITLAQYTQQGISNIKDSPARLDAAKQAAQAMGAELKAFYLTMGQYDMVVRLTSNQGKNVVEAP